MIEKYQFKNLFLKSTPMLDVRAPCEFEQGSFPNTTNIPLLSDEERHQVGLCYKQKGQNKAIELGHEIVSGETKKQRIKVWKEYCQVNPGAYLYCYRGGMRSHLVQSWLQQEGISIPLIKGGFKALRKFLLEALEQPLNMLRISGQTGVGKTELLETLNDMIDLEGIANHRGSAFGSLPSKQPAQIDFDNQLAIKLLNFNQNQTIIVEDESRYIGGLNLPSKFIENMVNSPVIILECSQENRVERIYQDYVVKQRCAFISAFAEKGEEKFSTFLQEALEKIQKRLGGLRYKQLSSIMQKAIESRSKQLHTKWINELLVGYYDPMYNYQIENKKHQIIFSGSAKDIKDFLLNLD